MQSLNSHLLGYIDYPAGRSKRIGVILRQLSGCRVKLGSFVAKGSRSTVFKGNIDSKECAVKVLRSDTVKVKALFKEYEFLERLKNYGFVPHPYCGTSLIVVMEFVEGIPFGKAFRSIADAFEKKKLVLKVLEACYTMDIVGIRHAELSGEKHILVCGPEKDVKIIDFESAFWSSKPGNLTQFMGYHILRDADVFNLFGIARAPLLKLLSLYKSSPHMVFNILSGFLRKF